MCGIVGYIGDLDTDQLLLTALEKLTYRGYDSAGIAVLSHGSIQTRKAAGKIRNLDDALSNQPAHGTCGIGHTRWATHGAPDAVNAHPHVSADGRIAVVHNGIIENHAELRNELKDKGIAFASQTDTEVIPQLLSQIYRGNPIAAVQEAVKHLEGSYAFAAVFVDQPERIIVARKGSPLFIGRGKGHIVLASDFPALLTPCSKLLHPRRRANCRPQS